MLAVMDGWKTSSISSHQLLVPNQLQVPSPVTTPTVRQEHKHRISGNISGELNLAVEAWTIELSSAKIFAPGEAGQLGLTYRQT